MAKFLRRLAGNEKATHLTKKEVGAIREIEPDEIFRDTLDGRINLQIKTVEEKVEKAETQAVKRSLKLVSETGLLMPKPPPEEEEKEEGGAGPLWATNEAPVVFDQELEYQVSQPFVVDCVKPELDKITGQVSGGSAPPPPTLQRTKPHTPNQT